jgi:hypothetical protein
MPVQDFKTSGSMEPFFQLFAVPRVLRKAACLMRGLEVTLTSDELCLKQLCALPWFNVVERFPLDGTPGLQKRRDLRSGAQKGYLLRTEEGKVHLQATWDSPLAGCAHDTLYLEEGGEVLVHQARAEIGSGAADFTAVYRRYR